MKIQSVLACAIPCLVVSTAFVTTPACKSDSPSAENASVVFGTLGVVSGPADSHCTKSVTVDPAQCTTPKKDDAPVSDASAAADGGDAGANGGGGSDFGETAYGYEADDDDCKYHVKWAMNAAAQKTNVTFTVVVTAKADGAPQRSSPLSAEVFLDDTHPAPNSGQKSSESSTPGQYTVGPIQFDAPGKWTVRFHFHEECADSEESPHGHAAFFVQIP